MKVAAVICEFNPFHNGHRFLFDTIKKEYCVDHIICIMSGDFVQRGIPAVFNKEVRTKAALLEGADAVILLPVPFATSSADLFAYSAVYILNQLNSVDYLFFGSECGDISRIKDCALKVIEAGSIDSPKIRSLMEAGLTFAKARAAVLPEYADLLASPNNTLGIEYCKSLIELNSSIEPVTIARNDYGYNSNILGTSGFASATAIREKLLSNETLKVSAYVPTASYDLFKSEAPLSSDDFSDMLFQTLISTRDYSSFYGISEDLSRKIRANLYKYNNYSGFADLLKSKDLTHSRITRGLCHILTGIMYDNPYYKNRLTELQYVRLLGINENSRQLLNALGSNSSLKLISKVPDYIKEFNEFTARIFEAEVQASAIYDYKSTQKNGTAFVPEYSKPFIKVK